MVVTCGLDSISGCLTAGGFPWETVSSWCWVTPITVELSRLGWLVLTLVGRFWRKRYMVLSMDFTIGIDPAAQLQSVRTNNIMHLWKRICRLSSMHKCCWRHSRLIRPHKLFLRPAPSFFLPAWALFPHILKLYRSSTSAKSVGSYVRGQFT